MVHATDLEVYATVVDGRLESRHRVVLPLRVQTKQLNAGISQFQLYMNRVVTSTLSSSELSNTTLSLCGVSLPHRTITFSFYDGAILRKQDLDTLKVRFQVVLVSFFPSLFTFEPLIRKL